MKEKKIKKEMGGGGKNIEGKKFNEEIIRKVLEKKERKGREEGKRREGKRVRRENKKRNKINKHN